MRSVILLLLTVTIGCAQLSSGKVGGPFEDNDFMYKGMPAKMDHIDTMSAWSSSAKKLMIYGVIYQPDGKTPAPGVILYYYHTNAKGLYAPAKNQTQAVKHGELRGWVKTNAKGEYKIYTIQPGAYPNRNIPAHVHMNIKEPAINEYYIDDIEFDDDPLLTTQERKKNTNRGGSGIMITGDKNGVMTAERNITLGLHIPDYPVTKNTSVASGLSVGEPCPAFDPIHLSGIDKGKKRCPMCSYGFQQGVIIWWNDPNLETLATMLKDLDPLITQYGPPKLRVFVVNMNPQHKRDEAVKKDMMGIEKKAALKNCALLYIPSPDDVTAYNDFQLNMQARNTIIIYRKRKVVDKFVNYSSADIKPFLKRLEL